MSNIIHLNAAQAAAIAGPSTVPGQGYCVIEPIGMTDGTFIVGMEVLSDPAFADRHVAMSALPRADYAAVMSASSPDVVAAIVSSGGAIIDPPSVVVSAATVSLSGGSIS